MTRTEADITPH